MMILVLIKCVLGQLGLTHTMLQYYKALYLILAATLGPRVYSFSNRNEYQRTEIPNVSEE
jgi:DNA-binding transcriptional MerR regulator